MPRFLVRGVLPSSQSGDSEYHDVTAEDQEAARSQVSRDHPEYEKVKVQLHPEGEK